MLPLTKRQKEIFNYIKSYIIEHDYAPTYREVMRHFGFSSLATVHKHMDTLRKKGLIKLQKYGARSIALIHSKNLDPAAEPAFELPFMGLIAAGVPIETFAQTETIPVPRTLVKNPGKSYLLRIRGDSMMDEHLLDGDLIVVEARKEARSGETVVALVNGSEATLKRYVPEGKYARLEPANPAFQPIVVRQDNLAIQGILVALLRKF